MLPVLSYIQHYKKYYTAQFEAASAAYGLNQLEIDILLFLHNNPECHTAGGICRYRGLAKSNVSAAVERLRARRADGLPCAGQPPPAVAGLYCGRSAHRRRTGRDTAPNGRAAV